jgi:hypothetical protein
MRTQSPVLTAIWALALAAAPCAAQGRPAAPTSTEIADKASKASLDRGRSQTRSHAGKRVTYTPSIDANVNSKRDAEPGVFAGVLETEVAGGEGRLEPGRYNLFLAKVRGDWYVHTETGGVIVRVDKVQGRIRDMLEGGDASPGGGGAGAMTDAGAMDDGGAPGARAHGPQRGALPDRRTTSCAHLSRASGTMMWPLVPYTACYYACAAATGEWGNCGGWCEAKYPL